LKQAAVIKPLSSVTYWNHFVRYCDEHNIDADNVIEKFSPTDKQDFILFEEFKALIEEVSRKSDISWVGLDVAQNIQISSHGSLGFAVTHGVNLKECLTLISRYYQTRLQAMEVQSYIEGDFYILSVTETCDWQPISVVLYEVLALTLLNVIEYIIGNEVQRCLFNFPYAEPAWSDKYYELIPCSVTFGQETAFIKIPVSLLSIPCVSSNSRSVDFAKSQCDIELSRISHYETLSEKISYLIESNHSYGLTLEVVAKHLNMSKSTLTRKLKLEETSYKFLLENLKKQQASKLLLETDLTVEAIAFELAYEDHSNFGRSFKRWFGCSPSTYRQNHQP